MIKTLFNKYKEAIMYIFFGVLTTIVNWISYAFFTLIIPNFNLFDIPEGKIIISNFISWIVAVLFAFLTNKIWVFNSKSFKLNTVLKELSLFMFARLLTGVIEWIGVPLLVSLGLNQQILGIDGMLSKVTVSVIVIILNYIFSKLVVFK